MMYRRICIALALLGLALAMLGCGVGEGLAYQIWF